MILVLELSNRRPKPETQLTIATLFLGGVFFGRLRISLSLVGYGLCKGCKQLNTSVSLRFPVATGAAASIRCDTPIIGALPSIPPCHGVCMSDIVAMRAAELQLAHIKAQIIENQAIIITC